MKLPALFTNSLRVAIAAALFTTQILPAADVRPMPSAIDLLIQKARSLEARDRQDLAAQVWHQVLVTDPNQPEALAALARWAKRTGRTDEANTYLAKLRRLAPDSPALSQLDTPDADSKGSSRLDEAARLTANKRYDEAMRIYRDVFGSNPPAGGWSPITRRSPTLPAGSSPPSPLSSNWPKPIPMSRTTASPPARC
jgi:cellulose synthase operon protein C